MESVDIESAERDRELLSPDFKDPIAESAETATEVKVRKDPPFFQGGVIDVDAGGLDFPSGFPDIPETFGFGGAFSNRFPEGGLFGLSGFFGNNDFKPWWKGLV